VTFRALVPFVCLSILLAGALSTDSGCTLITKVETGCSAGRSCVGLNRRFGIDGDTACEQWYCEFVPGQAGHCEFGPIDRDGDGFPGCGATGTDCADEAPLEGTLTSPTALVSPSVPESMMCNGVDDDCDGVVDERASLEAGVVSMSDVGALDRSTFTVLDEGFAWASTTRTLDGMGNDFGELGLHRVVPGGPLASRVSLGWSFDDPEFATASLSFVPGTPEPAPGSLPPWTMVELGDFADAAVARITGGMVVAAINGEPALCDDGRLRIGIVPTAGDPLADEVQVIGGPPRDTLADDDELRSAIALLVDGVERDIGGVMRWCTGPEGASRVALAFAPDSAPGFGLVLYAAETVSTRRACGGAPVELRALGLVEETGLTTSMVQYRWISGLQAPDDTGGMGAGSLIESHPIGTITGAAPAAVVGTEDGQFYVAFPDGSDIVLLQFDRPAPPAPYLVGRDPESVYTGLMRSGMPLLPEPRELARFAAPGADHVAIAMGVGENALGLTWQEGCGAGEDSDVGRIVAATYGLTAGVGPSEPVVISELGSRPTLTVGGALVRAGWPVAALGGDAPQVGDGFWVAYLDGRDMPGVAVTAMLRDGRVLPQRTSVLAAGAPLDAVESAVSATRPGEAPTLVMLSNRALYGAALECE
jgi:hypothetical protein